MRRGALIVLEGCDRSGKSTQCKKLVETLRQGGKKAELMRFPERTTDIGKLINRYLEKSCEVQDNAVHLLFSANRWELVPEIKEKLKDGVTLIIDRYAYSGVAFTAAKEGFTLDWCKQSDVGLPLPDLVVYLEISNEAAAKRGQYGVERYEKTDFQARVAQNYKKMMEDDWKILNADQTIEDLHRQLEDVVQQTMDSDLPELGKLWTKDQATVSGKTRTRHIFERE